MSFLLGDKSPGNSGENSPQSIWAGTIIKREIIMHLAIRIAHSKLVMGDHLACQGV
jgi:hypothetical protein